MESEPRSSQDASSDGQIKAGKGSGVTAEDLKERLREAFKPNSNVHMRQPTDTPAAGYDSEWSYMLPSCRGSTEDIPWLPQEAADWLYNATHYTIPLLQTLLGTHKAFNAEGCYVDYKNNT